MSGGDYFHCPICDRKALYDPSDETPDVEVLHRECLAKLRAEVTRLTSELAASRLRECTALCRDVEEDRDSMLPVVEAVRVRLGAGANDDADALVAGVERMAAERDRYRRERDDAHQLIAQYAPIAVPILADIKARKERAARVAAHTHYCWTCSDGSAPGQGCHNCRNTGMDQTPCVGCPGPLTSAPSGTEASRDSSA